MRGGAEAKRAGLRAGARRVLRLRAPRLSLLAGWGEAGGRGGKNRAGRELSLLARAGTAAAVAAAGP